MKKFYEEPEFDLMKFAFDNVLTSEPTSDPEAPTEEWTDYEGNI